MGTRRLSLPPLPAIAFELVKGREKDQAFSDRATQGKGIITRVNLPPFPLSRLNSQRRMVPGSLI